MRKKTGPKPIDVMERFWPKVNKTESCWLWTASAETKAKMRAAKKLARV